MQDDLIEAMCCLVQSEEGVSVHPPEINFQSVSIYVKKMRRNRKSMLTDRPDVPRTPFGRLKPQMVFWGKHENAPTL